MRFYALYLTRFANGFWFITLITLMPEYVDLLDPSGLTLGMFYTGFTPAQTIAVVPLAWLDDRYDRRGVLLSVLVTAIVTYVLFAAVSPSVTFVSVRALQGVAVTGSGLISLALVGELAEPGTRANNMVRRGVHGHRGCSDGRVRGRLLVPRRRRNDRPQEPILRVGAEPPDHHAQILPRPVRGVGDADPLVGAAVRGGLGDPRRAGVRLPRGARRRRLGELTNTFCQPFTGRLSDRAGRSLFVLAGGGVYGLVAVAVPFSPQVGVALGLPATFPVVGPLSAAFLPLVALNGLLGVADAFREPAALFAEEGTRDGGSHRASESGNWCGTREASARRCWAGGSLTPSESRRCSGSGRRSR